MSHDKYKVALLYNSLNETQERETTVTLEKRPNQLLLIVDIVSLKKNAILHCDMCPTLLPQHDSAHS